MARWPSVASARYRPADTTIFAEVHRGGKSHGISTPRRNLAGRHIVARYYTAAIVQSMVRAGKATRGTLLLRKPEPITQYRGGRGKGRCLNRANDAAPRPVAE